MRLQLEKGDIAKIAKNSGYSETTIRQWIGGKLDLPEATEKKIIDAYTKIAANRKAVFEAIQNHLTDVSDRVTNFQNEITSTLEKLSTDS